MFYVGGHPVLGEPNYPNGNIILTAPYVCWYFDGIELFVGGSGIHTIDFAQDGQQNGPFRFVLIDFECFDPFYYEDNN
jgi:hypothetical protein